MKKSMLTLFAFSALIMSSNIHTLENPHDHYGHHEKTDLPTMNDGPSDQDGNDELEASLHKLDNDTQNALQQLRSEWQSIETNLRSHHMNRMQKDQDMIQDMMSKGGLRAVEDAQGNIIGAYKTLGETKGYRYGVFHKSNLTQTPESVIESGVGTPANIAVSGASSTVLGYLDNPNFNGSMGSPKQIMLLQYTMPAQPVMDHAAPVASTDVVPASTVTVQSYNDNDENENNHKKHHHDNDHDDEHHHLITLF